MTSMSGESGRTEPFDPVGVIRDKRDGGVLSPRRIERLMQAYLGGEFAEEQMAALLMAIVWRGMASGELSAWTEAMIASGPRIDLSPLGLADRGQALDGRGRGQAVADPGAAGRRVRRGRAADVGARSGPHGRDARQDGGHRRLASGLGPDEMLRVLAEVGGVITAAGPELAPADRRLYALRDITATVESIPLIASSIMSKKVAEGTQSLLLDVKVGTGAFMTDLGRARRLAQTMVELGEARGVRTAAMITAMDTPLGRAVGNAVEVQEALDVLGGGGPRDVRDLVLAEAEAMLRLAGIGGDPAAALDDGRALRRFQDMVTAQGGDLDQPLPRGQLLGTVPAERDGVLRRLDARAVGMAAWRLGAGRSRPGEAVSAAAGIMCLAKPGDRVTHGQPIADLWGDDPWRLDTARAELAGAIEIGDDPPPAQPLVIERIGC